MMIVIGSYVFNPIRNAVEEDPQSKSILINHRAYNGKGQGSSFKTLGLAVFKKSDPNSLKVTMI